MLSADNKQCVIDSPQCIQAVEFYKRLTQYGIVATQAELEQMFKEGRLGFVLTGSWLIAQLRKEAPEINFGVTFVPRPGMDIGENISFAGGEYLVVNKKTAHPREAIALAKFMAWKNNTISFCQIAGKFIPSSKLADEDIYYANRAAERTFFDQLKSSKFSPSHPNWPEMQDILELSFSEAVTNKKTVRQALKEAKAKIDRYLK